MKDEVKYWKDERCCVCGARMISVAHGNINWAYCEKDSIHDTEPCVSFTDEFEKKIKEIFRYKQQKLPEC